MFHVCLIYMNVEPCKYSAEAMNVHEAHSSRGNPNCERVSFVRQQLSLTMEKGDLSGRVEGSK